MNASHPDGRPSDPSALRLMPMIDVVFLLLVFFLCATTFPSPEGLLKTWLPKDRGIFVTIPEPPDPGEVQLYLRMQEGICSCDHGDRSAPGGARRFPMVTQPDPRTGIDEIVPDWGAVEAYLFAQKKHYDRHGSSPHGLPVVIDFTSDVTWKYVARIVDVCTGLEIKDLQVSVPELALNH